MANRWNTNSLHWHQRQKIPRTCGPRIRRPKCVLHQKYHYYDDHFWNQRRREVLQKLDCLNICDQFGSEQPRQIVAKKSKKMRRSRCYICLIRGHAYWNCPNKNRRGEFKKGKQVKVEKNEEETGIENATTSKYDDIVTASINWQIIGTDGGDWNDIWYVSDEYPRHMTPNLELFYKFKSKTPGSSVNDKNCLNVQGIGEVILQTEIRQFVIPGVYYVPNAGLNTLSLGQSMQQGFDVIFKNSNCTVKRLFDNTSSEGCSDTEKDEGCEGKDARPNMFGTKAMEAVMNYCDSLYYKENTIEELVNGNQEQKVPSKFNFENFVGFMNIVDNYEEFMGCKDVVKDHFEKLVIWFYKEYLEVIERPMPVKIHGIRVCLLDLYLTVKGMGGIAQVTMKNKWIGVAYAIGFPKEYAGGLKECYGTHLSLLEAYYDVAKEYSSGVVVPKAMDCTGTSGIKAEELPIEGTDPGCSGTSARQDDERLKGRILFDNGEEQIITSEDCDHNEPTEGNATRDKEGSGKGMSVDKDNNDGDYIIVGD